jgi:signal transduction histidine kinase
LRKILIYGEELEENFSKDITNDGKVFLSKIIDASNRMNNLLSDLLDFSKISYNGPKFTSVNFPELLNEVLNDLSISIEKNSATIDLKINVGNVYLNADRSQLFRVFQNLVSNSLKYSKKNISPNIKISIDDDDVYKVISVEDNGIGFDEKYKDKIFEQFQRLHGKDEYSGTGMGLAIVKKIIENHQGKIEVTSKQNEGTLFKLFLPNEQKEVYWESMNFQKDNELIGT